MKRATRNSAGQFAKVRQPPPDLEFRCPDCPFCDKETDSDGESLRCYNCEAIWDIDGRRGSWEEPNEIACPSMIQPYNNDRLAPEHESIRYLTEHCILADDHGGKHRAEDSWYTWEDGDPRIVRKAVTS